MDGELTTGVRGPVRSAILTTLERVHRPSQLFPVVRRDAVAASVGSGAVEKSSLRLWIEKKLAMSGFDKLPLTEHGRKALEDLAAQDAEVVSQYTGRLMLERGFPEVPPACVSNGGINIGDRVVPVVWSPVGTFGAQFDLPYVPQAGIVRRTYFAPVRVTVRSFPPGWGPSDPSREPTVIEKRLVAVDLADPSAQDEGVGKDVDAGRARCPLALHESTMVLRMRPLAAPSGETG